MSCQATKAGGEDDNRPRDSYYDQSTLDSQQANRHPSSPRTVTWIHVGALHDGLDSVRDAHVVFDESSVLYVGTGRATPPRRMLRPGQTAPDLDDANLVALPALIDAHTHLFLDGAQLDQATRAERLKQPLPKIMAEARAAVASLPRFGLAGVRDAGDRMGVGLALATESWSNHALPYVESPGAAIHRRGAYGAFMSFAIEDDLSLLAAVERRIHVGADRIKLITTGVVDFTTTADTVTPQMSVDEIRTLVDAARSFGRQTFAHASGAQGINRAIEGGVDSIEHGYFVRDDQLAMMRDRDIAWVPTFAPVQAQVDHAELLGWDAKVVGNLRRILEGHAASLRRAHSLGVRIVAGSDAGTPGVRHGQGLLDELTLMQAAGMPGDAVITAATGAGAERFGYGDRIGRIMPGFRSRLVLLPLSAERFSSLPQDATVIYDGAFRSPAA